MCAKKRHRTSSDYLRYLKDDLSKQERHELERGLEADPFEKEAMEGLESISPEKAEEELLSLHASLRKRLGRRKRVVWYSIAATAASILIVGSIFLNIYEFNPNKANRKIVTEESFRSLDSDDEKASPTEEAPFLEAPFVETPLKEAPAESPPVKAAEPKSSKKNIAQARKVNPPEKQETEQVPKVAEDLEVMEFAMADEARLEVVANDEIEAETRIIAKEAAPREKSQSTRNTKRAIIADHEVEQALTGRVSGIVVSSEDMDPLPGASIVIRGSNSGTVADMEGRFTLPSDDSQTTVLASFIGMETEEYQLNSESNNQLVMQPDPVTLDEVVIVAQGNKRLSGLSMSSTTIEKDDTSPSYTPAQPEDGYRAFKEYMEQNMVFPSDYLQGEREVVILRFTVLPSGSITDIQTLRTPGEAYTLEAIRLIKEGPAWTPASITSGPVDEQVRVRIVFKK